MLPDLPAAQQVDTMQVLQEAEQFSALLPVTLQKGTGSARSSTSPIMLAPPTQRTEKTPEDSTGMQSRSEPEPSEAGRRSTRKIIPTRKVIENQEIEADKESLY